MVFASWRSRLSLLPIPSRLLSHKQLSPRLVQALIVAIGTGYFIPSVQAAEQVVLQYGNRTRSFPIENIETFARSGQISNPDLEAFFQDLPEVRRLVQELFSAEITIGPALAERIQQGNQSPTIDFVLLQLNKLISSPQTPEALEPLRTAVRDSLSGDGRISLVELIRYYPESDIQLNLTGLEPIYNDVKAFVERILPALEVARDTLRELVCDCPTTAAGTDSSTVSPTVSAKSLTPATADCLPQPVSATPASMQLR